ncbi:MAG: LamG-like jellyroll fold domain-containing protein [Silvanigrellaceae bacterium]
MVTRSCLVKRMAVSALVAAGCSSGGKTPVLNSNISNGSSGSGISPTPASGSAVIPPIETTGSFLTGVLVDETGNAVPDMELEIESTNFKTKTDNAGQFEIPLEKVPLDAFQFQLKKSSDEAAAKTQIPQELASLIAAAQLKSGSNVSIERMIAFEIPSRTSNSTFWQTNIASDIKTYSLPPLTSPESLIVNKKLIFNVAAPIPGSYSSGSVTITGQCLAGALLKAEGDVDASASNTTNCSNNGDFSLPVTLGGADGSKLVNLVQQLNSGVPANALLVLQKDSTGPILNFSPPSVGIVKPTSSPTSVVYTLNFSDGPGSGLTSLSLDNSKVGVINSSGTGTCSNVAITGSGLLSRTLTISGCSGDGPVLVEVLAGVATDALGNSSTLSTSPIGFTISSATTTPTNFPPAFGAFTPVQVFTQVAKDFTVTISDPDDINQVACSATSLSYTLPGLPTGISIKPILWTEVSSTATQRVCKGTIEFNAFNQENVPASFNLNLTLSDGQSSISKVLPVQILDTNKTALLYNFNQSLANTSNYNSIAGVALNNTFTGSMGLSSYVANGIFGHLLKLNQPSLSVANNISHEFWTRRATIELLTSVSQELPDRTWLVGKNGSWKLEIRARTDVTLDYDKIEFSIMTPLGWSTLDCNIGGAVSANATTSTHLAMTFDEGNAQLYMRGVLCASATLAQKQLPISSQPILLGPTYAGNIDEFRVSRAVRYTSNFTPPTAPFALD